MELSRTHQYWNFDIIIRSWVRRSNIEALAAGEWKILMEASSIGHKFIHPLQEPVTAELLKLSILKAVGTPAIINLSVGLVKAIRENEAGA